MPIRAVLYPALQAPPFVSTAETVTIDKWFQPTSQPLRQFKPLPTGGGQVAMAASILPEDTTVDRWFWPWDPPRRPKPTLSAARYLSVQAPPFVAPPETVTLDKWFSPLSEPIRSRKPLPTGARPFFWWSDQAATQPETTTADRWFQPLGEPRWSRPALRRGSLPSFFFDPNPIPTPPETVTLDKWFAPLSEPVRYRKPQATAQKQAFHGDPWALTQAEATTPDRWFQPLGERLRQPARVHPSRLPSFFAEFHSAFTLPEVVTVDKWFAPASQPVMTRHALAAAQQVAFWVDPWALTLPSPSVAGCPQGAFFDGTDYMKRGAGLTGAADGPFGTFSIWFRKNGGDGAAQQFFRNNAAVVNFFISATNQLSFVLKNVGGTITLRYDSTGTYLASSTWHHVVVSYTTNLAAGSKIIKAAIDGVVDPGTITDVGASFNVDNTDTDWAVGAAVNATNKANADFAELWWDDGTYLDLTVAANVQKFIKANGDTANLGTDGSAPTGAQPLVYLKGPAASFPTNRGTGGNFTVTGALTDSLTSPPCDTPAPPSPPATSGGSGSDRSRNIDYEYHRNVGRRPEPAEPPKPKLTDAERARRRAAVEQAPPPPAPDPAIEAAAIAAFNAETVARAARDAIEAQARAAAAEMAAQARADAIALALVRQALADDDDVAAILLLLN